MTAIFDYAIGGNETEYYVDEYGIEPCRGGDAMCLSEEISDPAEALQHIPDGRLVRRRITIGPWEYVPRDDDDCVCQDDGNHDPCSVHPT